MTARTIIYLHGFASGPASSKAKYFAESCRRLNWKLLVPDLNYPDFERMTLSSQLDLIASLLEDSSFADTCFAIVGSSMGGLLATLAANKHRNVCALILMAPAFGIPRRWQKLWGDDGLKRWQDNGFLEVQHYGFGKPMHLGLSFLDDLEQHKTDGIKISVPALVFHGCNDEIVPVNESIEFAQINRQIDLRILEDDHQLLFSLPEIWKESEAFLRMLWTDLEQ